MSHELPLPWAVKNTFGETIAKFYHREDAQRCKEGSGKGYYVENIIPGPELKITCGEPNPCCRVCMCERCVCHSKLVKPRPPANFTEVRSQLDTLQRDQRWIIDEIMQIKRKLA